MHICEGQNRSLGTIGKPFFDDEPSVVRAKIASAKEASLQPFGKPQQQTDLSQLQPADDGQSAPGHLT